MSRFCDYSDEEEMHLGKLCKGTVATRQIHKGWWKEHTQIHNFMIHNVDHRIFNYTST